MTYTVAAVFTVENFVTRQKFGKKACFTTVHDIRKLSDKAQKGFVSRYVSRKYSYDPYIFGVDVISVTVVENHYGPYRPEVAHHVCCKDIDG